MLRAKSQYKVENVIREKGLAEHCREVMDSFEALFGVSTKPTRLARAWLRFFKLPESIFPTFHGTGVVACGTHDVGKANDGFQSIVSPDLKNKASQAIRHEHLSGLLLALPDAKCWLESLPNVDAGVALSAVIAHHLKADQKEFARYLGSARAEFRVFAEDSEFQTVFHQVTERIGGLNFHPQVERFWSLDGGAGFDAEIVCSKVRDAFRKLKKELADQEKKPTLRGRLLMAVRAAVILADAAGSGLPRNNLPLTEWIQKQFKEDAPITSAYIEEKIISPRVNEIEKKSRVPFVAKDFQLAAGRLGSRALILAGCGSGKTMAAWYWIQNQLRDHTASRVIFLYPTRATATEGFKDYVSWAPEADAALVSGTAGYELDGMFDQPDDERKDKDFTVEERLYSLAFWKRKIFSATVDQFLGFMQHAYGGVCLLPVLADAVVVFDEVHSFDPKMFSALKRFLETFDIPVLCMTASLPKRRREDLLKIGLELFPGEQEFKELEKLADHPRYTVKTLNSQNEAEEIALEAHARGDRVLWVVNTVDRCQQLARNLKALCYHSRFRLDDRKESHRAVVAAFQQTEKAVIAVTTQVCEMSLDLDADVLISEIAPITALIQRMGRCNRHAKVGDEKRGQVFFYKPESSSPYDEETDLEGVAEFVEAISGSEVGQSRLEELLETFGPASREKEALCRFLDDGPWATAESFRDIEDRTIQAVLESDIPKFVELVAQRKPTDGLLVSIPRKPEIGKPDWRLGKYILRAPSSHYSKEYGFFKEPQGGFDIC